MKAGAEWEDPWGTSRGEATSPAEKSEPLNAGQRIGVGAFNLFSKYISPVDGDRCPCYPTCSDYARQAIRKHGLITGFVMTFDRLLHEGDEVHRVSRVRVYGTERYYDPVENNDFWWVPTKGSKSTVPLPSK